MVGSAGRNQTGAALGGCSSVAIWDEGYLAYDLGGAHPMHPVRWELTIALADSLGVLDQLPMVRPAAASDAQDAKIALFSARDNVVSAKTSRG